MSHRSHLRQALRRNKSIDDPLLNRLGLQVARTVAAHGVSRLRRRRAADQVAPLLAQLDRDGFVKIRGLLGDADLQAVSRAARAVLDDPSVPSVLYTHGANEIQTVWRSDVESARRMELDRFFLHPTVLGLIAGAERMVMEPGAGRCTVQRLVQRDGAPDEQSGVHSDTFHPTYKLWLYLDDVQAIDGPLVYYPGSHRLSLVSLRGTYRESVLENGGSRRIDEAELRSRGIDAMTFQAGRGTVVMANTFGYHARAQGSPPGTRSVLHMEVRPAPFRRPPFLPADTSVAAAV